VNRGPGIMNGEQKIDNRKYTLSDEELEKVSGGYLI